MDWKDDESPKKLEDAFKSGRVEQSESLILALLTSLEIHPRRVEEKMAKDVLATLQAARSCVYSAAIPCAAEAPAFMRPAMAA